jgi:CubicO group peptidase (beta-lactamase class C family)
MSAGDPMPIGTEVDLGLPSALPEQHGFAADRLAQAMRLVEDGVASGAYPGSVAVVARHGAVVAATAAGHAIIGATPHPMRLDTVFDLASVTKVVAGASSVLMLLDAGVVCLDDPIARFLPGFEGDKRQITLRHLLTHTSGLPPWRPCYTEAATLEESVGYIRSLDLEAAPGEQAVYSDLGMALIRPIVRVAAGEDLPVLLQRALFTPLGMRDAGYSPTGERRQRAAATEDGNRFEQAMVRRARLHFAGWRSGLIRGEVHDGNAHYAMEGVSSHAGLFATAGDLVRFGRLMLQRGTWQGHRLLSAAAIDAATRTQFAGNQGTYGLGWRINERVSTMISQPARSELTRAIFPDDAEALPQPGWAGDLLPPDAYWHTGFTGTSIVICPSLDLLMILLTNRVHPHASRTGVERVRACWYNAVVASIMHRAEP